METLRARVPNPGMPFHDRKPSTRSAAPASARPLDGLYYARLLVEDDQSGSPNMRLVGPRSIDRAASELARAHRAPSITVRLLCGQCARTRLRIWRYSDRRPERPIRARSSRTHHFTRARGENRGAKKCLRGGLPAARSCVRSSAKRAHEGVAAQSEEPKAAAAQLRKCLKK